MEIAFVGALFLSYARFLSQKLNYSFFYFAPLALCAMEYFRNYLPFGGFPWGNSGYALGRIPAFLQSASVVGVYGLVFIVGLVNALICLALSSSFYKRIIILISTVILVNILYIYGCIRLYNIDEKEAPTVRIALLQGNIPQEMKNRSKNFAEEILEIYRTLHEQAKAFGAELIIWPEASYPGVFHKDSTHLKINFSHGAAAIIGATAYAYDKDAQSAHFYNSAFLQDYDGKLISRYDKSHLVPFGEYVPWPLENVVNKIVPSLGSYRFGTDIKPVELALNADRRLSIGTTICYEGIFPEITRVYAQKDTTLLINITNDAWYGKSSAPYQHLLMYQLRSVESGKPYVRATNTGISAWIDAHGRVRKQSSLFTREIIIDTVPLLTKTTVYATIGDIVPILCLLVLGFFSCVIIFQKTKNINSER
jgi:apolipoprotein N-acyltransferase